MNIFKSSFTIILKIEESSWILKRHWVVQKLYKNYMYILLSKRRFLINHFYQFIKNSFYFSEKDKSFNFFSIFYMLVKLYWNSSCSLKFYNTVSNQYKIKYVKLVLKYKKRYYACRFCFFIQNNMLFVYT